MGGRVVRANRAAMLLPKPRLRSPVIPAMPELALAFAIGKLAPPERRALAWIVETADVLEVEDDTFLLVPVDPLLLDILAAFGAEAEDREPCLEDERDEGEENDSNNDNALDVVNTGRGLEVDAGDLEPDAPTVRKRFADERRRPDTTWNGYNAAKDWEEMRAVRWRLRALKPGGP